jgi:hypothetical protein
MRDERVFEIGTLVKVSPFHNRDESKDYGSEMFNDERRVKSLGTSGDVRIERLNWWEKKHLLIKGVDYDG